MIIRYTKPMVPQKLIDTPYNMETMLFVERKVSLVMVRAAPKTRVSMIIVNEDMLIPGPFFGFT
jgi:hypothetical protein